jgi:hypothetical protein
LWCERSMAQSRKYGSFLVFREVLICNENYLVFWVSYLLNSFRSRLCSCSHCRWHRGSKGRLT